MAQWFEKEDFWINFAPIMFDDAHWQEAPTVAQSKLPHQEGKHRAY